MLVESLSLGPVCIQAIHKFGGIDVTGGNGKKLQSFVLARRGLQ